MNYLMKVSLEQIDYMKHCIGYEKSKVRRGKYKAYRNYFTTGEPDQSWDELVGNGLAKCRDLQNAYGSDPKIYSLTQNGIQFLQRLLGITITEQE